MEIVKKTLLPGQNINNQLLKVTNPLLFTDQIGVLIEVVAFLYLTKNKNQEQK